MLSPPKMSPSTLSLFLVAMAVVSPMAISGQDVGTPDGNNKCGGCPCNSPCTYASPPPPPLPSPPPPLPSPPPPPKNPRPPACPPPPDSIVPTPPGNIVPTPPGNIEPTPPSYIYITGPPGDVYPIDLSAAAGGGISGTVGLTILFLIACAVLQLAV